MFEWLFFVASDFLTQVDELRALSVYGITKTECLNTKIVPDRPFKGDFLERRRPKIAARRC